MAGKDFTLRATPAAVAAIERLRGRARKSYAAFEAELRKQGCRIAGYRLLDAEDGYSEYCCKRLVDDWRVIATFEPGIAIVVAVGRHDSRAFYDELSKKLSIGAVGQGRKEKPACCGKGGWPSVGSVPNARVERVRARLTRNSEMEPTPRVSGTLRRSSQIAAYRRISVRIRKYGRLPRRCEIPASGQIHWPLVSKMGLIAMQKVFGSNPISRLPTNSLHLSQRLHSVIPAPPAAISFDFWHTLVAEPAGLLAVLRREAVVGALVEQKVKVADEVLDIYLARAQAMQAEAWNRGEHFAPMRAAVHLADSIDGLGGGSRERLLAAYLDVGENLNLELSPGAAETVAALANGGIQLGIVCDVGLTGSQHLRAFLDRAGVLCHFKGWAFSDEVGHYKPSPLIFRHMLDQFELEKGDAVWHVGDLKRTDVAGARASDLVPIRYRGLVDDASEGPEADLVIDHFAQLVPLVRTRSE